MGNHPSEIIKRLFADVGNNSLRNEEEIRRLQKKCEDDLNPKSCYLTLRVNSYPYISWSHRTDTHFGVKALSYEGFLSLIHPAWTTLYYATGNVVYQLAKQYPERMQIPGIAYVTQVPLKTPAGYHWYDQISFPCGFSATSERELVAHLNYYHDLGPYRGGRPVTPGIIHHHGSDELMTPALNLLLPRIEREFLREFLTPGQIKFLGRYRRVLRSLGWRKPARRELVQKLQLSSKDNLDKIPQRTTERIQGHFEDWYVDDTHRFARFLDDYFLPESS